MDVLARVDVETGVFVAVACWVLVFVETGVFMVVCVFTIVDIKVAVGIITTAVGVSGAVGLPAILHELSDRNIIRITI